MGLFRSESEQARAGAWLGRVVLARPVSFAIMTTAALGIGIALLAFFIFGDYTRKARVTGVLAPAQGVVKVIAPQMGVVQALHVREGADVAKDAALLSIADARLGNVRTAAATAVIDSLDSRRLALRRQREHVVEAALAEQRGLSGRRGGIARELQQMDREIEAMARRVATAREGLARMEQLHAGGFISAAALDRDRDTLLEHQMRLEAATRSRLALAREAASLEFETTAALSRTNAQLAALDAQHAAADQEATERRLQYHASVAAPAAGLVATVLVEPGQMVTAGSAIATILPQGAALEAHLYAPSRSIGFVHAGQPVMLRYLAYPHQKFGSQRGRVVSIARHPTAPAELGYAPPDGSREPLYRIKVALEAQTIDAYGRPEPLQAGMQVEADILLDRRRLIEWIFEPLLSLAGRA